MTHAHPGSPRETDPLPVVGLPSALYLLACDPAGEKLTKRSVIGHVLRAAVLVELTERGCLRDEDGRARPAGDRRTGDPLLDQALRTLSASARPVRWKKLVGLERKQTQQAVEESLVAAGRITVEPRTWRYPRIVVHDAELRLRLCASVSGTLKGGAPVETVPPLRAALVALSAAAELPGVLSGKERRQYKKRIKALTEQAGEAAPALKKVLEEMQAVVAATVVTGGSS